MTDLEAPYGATPLDPDEAAGLKHPGVTTRELLNELEAANIVEGLAWVKRQTDLREVMTEAWMRELHKRLFGEVWSWAGAYRQTEKNIGADPFQVPVMVRNLVDDARSWSEYGTYPALEAAARFHHRMVFIHPFPNGNGRHARVATDVYLRVCFEHAPVPWGGTALDQQGVQRTAYIAALRQADKGDLRPLFEFIGL